MHGHDAPVSHLDDPIGQGSGVLSVVGDVDSRQPERALQAVELATKRRPQVGVEAGEGLIQQKQTWLPDERSRQCRSLLLSTRDLVRVSVRQRVNSYERERVSDALVPPRFRDTGRAHHEPKVLSHREVRPERQILKDESDSTLMRRHEAPIAFRHAPAVEPDLAMVWYVQTSDKP